MEQKFSDLRLLKATEAEEFTGITKQQVHRWAKNLRNREKYRVVLFGVAYKRTMASQSALEAGRAAGRPETQDRPFRCSLA